MDKFVIAVMWVVVSPVLVACTGDDERRPTPDPPDATSVRVPQLLMMTPEQATETLDRVGLRAKIRHGAWNECDLPEGRVTETRPAPLRIVDSGASVVVRVTGGDPGGGAAYCIGPEAFEENALAMLDLARFGEGGPQFAPTVQVWVDGKRTATLTAQEAQNPTAWGDPSPLTRMLAAMEVVRRYGGKLRSPSVWSMRDAGSQFGCGSEDPPAPLSHRESIVVTIDHADGGGPRSCHWVRIYRDAEGRVDAVTSAQS
jgi:hypothetical protein